MDIEILRQEINNSWKTKKKKDIIKFLETLTNRDRLHIEITNEGTHFYTIEENKLVYLGMGNFE